MGRAKQSLELIRGEKARNLTFRKRKEGLKKKAHELKTLCDVEVCLIISGPALETMNAPPARELEIWPANPDNVQRLVDSYKNQSSQDRDQRSDNLSNFFERKRRDIESDLLKLQKKNEMAKYSTEWSRSYDSLSEEQLRDCACLMDAKLEYAKNRIEIVKGLQCCSSPAHIMNEFVLQQQPQYQPISTLFNPNEIVLPLRCYPFDQTPQGGDRFGDEHFVQSPLTMMPQMNSSCSYYDNAPTVADASQYENFSTHPPPMGFCSYDDCNSDSGAPLMAPCFQYPKMETDGVRQQWW